MRTSVCGIVAAIGLAAHPAFAQANRTAMKFWNGVQVTCNITAAKAPTELGRRIAQTAIDESPASAAIRLIPTAVCSTSAWRYNGAPSQELLVIRQNHKTGERTLEPLSWGLIPYWCKDLKGGRRPINAMAETVHLKPMFREAYERRRCIVPIDGSFSDGRLSRAKRNSLTPSR
jgi:hypothetical protein